MEYSDNESDVPASSSPRFGLVLNPRRRNELARQVEIEEMQYQRFMSRRPQSGSGILGGGESIRLRTEEYVPSDNEIMAMMQLMDIDWDDAIACLKAEHTDCHLPIRTRRSLTAADEAVRQQRVQSAKIAAREKEMRRKASEEEERLRQQAALDQKKRQAREQGELLEKRRALEQQRLQRRSEVTTSERLSARRSKFDRKEMSPVGEESPPLRRASSASSTRPHTRTDRTDSNHHASTYRYELPRPPGNVDFDRKSATALKRAPLTPDREKSTGTGRSSSSSENRQTVGAQSQTRKVSSGSSSSSSRTATTERKEHRPPPLPPSNATQVCHHHHQEHEEAPTSPQVVAARRELTTEMNGSEDISEDLRHVLLLSDQLETAMSDNRRLRTELEEMRTLERNRPTTTQQQQQITPINTVTSEEWRELLRCPEVLRERVLRSMSEIVERAEAGEVLFPSLEYIISCERDRLVLLSRNDAAEAREEEHDGVNTTYPSANSGNQSGEEVVAPLTQDQIRQLRLRRLSGEAAGQHF
jgi:hypothetical protein